MKYIIGVDIGNSSTETALAAFDTAQNKLHFLSSAISDTTGLRERKKMFMESMILFAN